jgi:hypothetical protein
MRYSCVQGLRSTLSANLAPTSRNSASKSSLAFLFDRGRVCGIFDIIMSLVPRGHSGQVLLERVERFADRRHGVEPDAFAQPLDDRALAQFGDTVAEQPAKSWSESSSPIARSPF